MSKRVATLFLQRNLPEITNKFAEHFLKWNGDVSDFYVIESGSDDDKLTDYHTFHANWEEARTNGMHFPRGFNFGLLELHKLEKVLEKEYDYIVLAMGDTTLYDEHTIEVMVQQMDKHERMAILAPHLPYHDVNSQPDFANNEDRLIAHTLMPHVFWMFRKEYMNDVINDNNDGTFMGYFYDGTNFRGYDTDTELILKAYQGDWFFGVTDLVKHYEISDLTEKNYKVMKTQEFSLHKDLMFNEGLEWLQAKYGFENKHRMRSLVNAHYSDFFNKHENLRWLTIW